MNTDSRKLPDRISEAIEIVGTLVEKGWTIPLISDHFRHGDNENLIRQLSYLYRLVPELKVMLDPSPPLVHRFTREIGIMLSSVRREHQLRIWMEASMNTETSNDLARYIVRASVGYKAHGTTTKDPTVQLDRRLEAIRLLITEINEILEKGPEVIARLRETMYLESKTGATNAKVLDGCIASLQKIKEQINPDPVSTR